MERVVLSQEEYMRRQIEEMFSAENKRSAQEALGHEPTKKELEWWYIEHGGPENFAKRYVQEKVVKTAEKKEERDSP